MKQYICFRRPAICGSEKSEFFFFFNAQGVLDVVPTQIKALLPTHDVKQHKCYACKSCNEKMYCAQAKRVDGSDEIWRSVSFFFYSRRTYWIIAHKATLPKKNIFFLCTLCGRFEIRNFFVRLIWELFTVGIIILLS